MTMERLTSLVILAIVAISSQSCLRDFDTPEEQDEQIRSYLSANNIDAQSDENGIYFYPINENPSGKDPSVLEVVGFYYNVTLLDGSEVARHQEADGPPVESFHEVGQLIPTGIDLGMRQMRVGETYGFVIPTRFAYPGLSIEGLIPLDAIILAEIEIVSALIDDVHETREINGIDQYILDQGLGEFEELPDGLRYLTIQAGVPGTESSNNQSIVVDYNGKLLDGELFDEQEDQVIILDENLLPTGLNTGLKKLLRDETAIIIVPSRLGFINSPLVIPQRLSNAPVQPFSVLVYEVTRNI